MFPYESPNFQQDIDEAWESIRPLYEELHAYIRRKLRDLYGPEKIGAHTPLPSHVLGKNKRHKIYLFQYFLNILFHEYIVKY